MQLPATVVTLALAWAAVQRGQVEHAHIDSSGGRLRDKWRDDASAG